MSYRETGGPGTGEDADVPGDVDIDQLRRTSPRRAARIEAERVRGDGFAAPAAAPPEQPSDQHAGPAAAHPGPDPADPEHDAGHDAGHEAAHDAAHDAAHPAVTEPGSYGADPDVGPYATDAAPYATDAAPYEAEAEAYATGAAPYADVHEEPFDPASVPEYLQPQDPFGDPVSDGYVGSVAYAAPSRRRRWGGLLALVVTLAVVGAAGWFAYLGLRPVIGDLQAFELFDTAEDYEGPGTGSVEVVVEPGDTGREMGATLVDADVVASVEAFVTAANTNPEFTSVQPGTYTLPQQLPAVDAVAALVDPANRVNDTLVIAEGLRVDQILDRLAEGTGLPREDLEAALAAAELPAAAPSAEGVVNPAEGFLYPDGYQFGPDPTAQEVIDQMIARGQEVLDELGVAPEDQLEVLTKASLVQGEARLDEDFGRVAQVVENRLAIDQPLGLDSTVNYATQTFDTRTTAEQRDSDSPYNTYRFPGLPPGPIKAPGRQAIEAVVSPTPGPWLYFVTVDLCTGETAFAETFEEHQENVAVLNAWQRENTDDDGNLICG